MRSRHSKTPGDGGGGGHRRRSEAAQRPRSLGLCAGTAVAAPADAPGAPARRTWTTGDKEGLGTSPARSKVWYTLTGGTMSEVYYPGGDTPNVRELQFAVTDGSIVHPARDRRHGDPDGRRWSTPRR